jgi:hypothetical protein
VSGSEVMAKLGRCLATKALRPSWAGPGRLTFLPSSVPTPPGPERRKLRLLLVGSGALPRAREGFRGGVLVMFVVELDVDGS